MERLTGKFENGGAFILPSVVSKLSPMKSEIIEKLADYEDAEEQGLLLRLPCPIGSEVWRIVNQRDNFTDRTYKIVFRTTFRLDMINRIGETVFLTREEAEQALADMGV